MLDRGALKSVLEAIGRKDGAAFHNLFKDQADRIFALALRILGDEARATEALHNSFIEIWRQAASAKTEWELPDLELMRICRNVAIQIMRRSPGQSGATVGLAMTDPVADGTASFELLQLLQTLGRLSDESREILTTQYFECRTQAQLAELSAMTLEETDATIRRCYAEFVAADDGVVTVLDRDADYRAKSQALGFNSQSAKTDPSFLRAWELRFAPFAELLVPVSPPEGAFEAIMQRVNAETSTDATKASGRRAEGLRAVLFVGIAAVAAILIYFALVAIGDDAAAAAIAIL